MKVRISIASALVLPLVFASTAFALENSTTAQDESVSTTAQAPTDTKQEPLNQEQKTQLQERLNKRKTDAKLRLTTVQEKRLQTRCTNAQGLVKSVNGRSVGIEANRSKIHSNLVQRLTTLETKLAAKDINTDMLKTNITELQNKITAFESDFTVYKQAVADVSNIEDCTTDPVAFKASLDAARTALQKVRDDSVAIRAYVKDSIKPTLTDLRTELSKVPDTDTGAN